MASLPRQFDRVLQPPYEIKDFESLNRYLRTLHEYLVSSSTSFQKKIEQFSYNTLDDSATPSVNSYFKHSYWVTGGTTTITNFTDGYEGQIITVLAQDHLIIEDNANIVLLGGVDFEMMVDNAATLIFKSDGVWHEIARVGVGAFLTGVNGTIWYAWDGEVVELPPDTYGKVLTDGGGDVPPFWDWVWQAPGGYAATAFVIDVSVWSSVSASKITIASSFSPTGAITSEFASDHGPDSSWYTAEDYAVDSSVDPQKITISHDSDQSTAAIGTEIVMIVNWTQTVSALSLSVSVVAPTVSIT